MRVALYTPMPPARTGVAHYASMLAPALAKAVELEVISSPPATRHPLPAIYQLGNNPHHEWIYKEAMEHPGVVVLHDMVLHHLIVEMTLARGDVAGYVAALEANHGAAGAAWARGRAAGLHSEMGNFLLPASIEVANRSRAVIVHNRYAADRLQSLGVTAPIHVVPHPYERHHVPSAGRKFVAGLFGFLTSAKRSEVVLEALREARAVNRDVRLLVVGEPAPNIDTAAFAGDGIVFTGYVPDEEFANYFGEVDRIVNLRYPSAGETSGTLIRAFDAGKPVAVSDYAQFAELPDDCVTKIPLGGDEVAALARFLTATLPDPSEAQRRWLETNARIESTVAGYLAALSGAPTPSAARVQASLPLFPKLGVVNSGQALTIRNAGDSTLYARQYGEPGYRLVANGRWLELPRDLPPGATASIDLPHDLRGVTLTLVHAMQGVPIVEPEVWARVPVQ
jgi:glycosyltransferase involved in cell wall biosynthesis